MAKEELPGKGGGLISHSKGQTPQWSSELGGFSQRQAWFRGSLLWGFCFGLQLITGLERLLKFLPSLYLCFKVLQVFLATKRNKGKRVCVPGKANPVAIQVPHAKRHVRQIAQDRVSIELL